MNATVVTASKEMPIRKYELGRPIIRREQRIAFEGIHRAVAQAWSDSMAEYLPNDAALEFEGLVFGAWSPESLDDDPCAQIALFSIGSTLLVGFLVISGALAKLLVSARLGLKSTNDDKANQPFTRIEATIARETTRAMLTRLSDAYAAAGLGSIGNIRECENCAVNFPFAPDESLCLLSFGTSVGGEQLRLLIGLSSSIVSAVSEHSPAAFENTNGRSAIANVASQLPIEVEVVLGTWKVSLRELLQLRAGDKIVLPDGEDAWLSARGVRIRRAGVEVTSTGASVEILKRARMR
jgi:flagellar motor switch protein FliM